MKNEKRTRRFTLLIAILSVLGILGCAPSGSDAASDVTAPTVEAVTPLDTAVDVAINGIITATFSEAMDSATISASSFTVTGLAAVTGTVAYDATSKTATFSPTANLAVSTLHSVSITTAVKDVAGNALAADKAWVFTTGTAADTTAPTVTSTSPVDTATGVAVGSAISVTFSEAMNQATLSNITVSPAAAGVSSYDAFSHSAIITPASPLTASTTYTVTVATGVKDLAGNGLAAANVFSFTTAAASADTTAPTVASTLPAQSALNVAVSANITATFDEEMDLATMVGANFTVWKDTVAVAGVVTFDQPSKTITFNPGADLIAAGAFGPVYTARITIVAQDLAGNNLVQDKVWTFTPGSDTRAAVDLLTAGDFVILAQQTITTTGTTAINGDLGLSPAAVTLYTGFGETYRDATDAIVGVGAARYARSSLVSGIGVWPTVGSGKIFSVDFLADAGVTKTKVDTAVADRITAYNDAAGRATPDGLNLGTPAGTINAVTFAPGLYKWGTNLEITGDITLTGTATDIWIFQVSGTINLASAKQIILSGGALPQNVFWQASGITTLVTNSVFKGIILGASNIVLQTGATLNGRALSFTAVTLDAATVTQP
ncbi:MAG: Ig-like domain-containing protein [Treponemataceae bacterium]